MSDFLFKLLLWQYFKEFLYDFLCFSVTLDNNVQYVRAKIFNSRTKYTSPNVRYCYDVNTFINLFNKIKSQLKFSLPFFIFVWVLRYFFYIFIFYLLYYQKRFYCHTFDKEFFLTSLNISMNKLSLIKSQSSFTYIKVFNYDSFNLNQTLLIRSDDVKLKPDPNKSSSLAFFN